MKFIIDLIKGIVIGSGAILPGISSGVICVVLGIYENLLDRITNFFKSPWDNLKFFTPFVIGGAIGAVLVGKLLLFLFENYNTPTCFCFIGLILGCFPSILKQAKGTKIRNYPLSQYLILILTFCFSIYLILLEKYTIAPNSINAIAPTYTKLIISGFLMSVGIVVPGISSSVILMLAGTYEVYLASIANINLTILFPMGIGLVVGCILFLNLINFLFKHFKSHTYFAICGFTLGSAFILLPDFRFDFVRIAQFGFMPLVFCGDL